MKALQAPVTAKWIPKRTTFGLLARLATVPVAIVGAGAIGPNRRTFVSLALIAGVLVMSTVANAKKPSMGRVGVMCSAAVVWIAVMPALEQVIAAMTQSAAKIVGTKSIPNIFGHLIAAFIAFTYARIISQSRRHEDLGQQLNVVDEGARLLLPLAIWFGFAGLHVRFAAEAVHAHNVLPIAAMVLIGASITLSLAAAVLLIRQATWTARLYAGSLPGLHVGRHPDGQTVPLHWTTHAPCESVLLSRSRSQATKSDRPYRAEHDTPLVMMPTDPRVLVGRYRTAGVQAIVCLLFASLAVPLVLSDVPKLAHATELREPVPPMCRAVQHITFVPLEGTKLMSTDSLAKRYQLAYGIPTRVGPTFPLSETFFNEARGQIMAESLLASVRSVMPAQKGHLIVVVTDRDMYLRHEDWKFALGARAGNVSVVSLAHMDPKFPAYLSNRTPVPYVASAPKANECDLELRSRAYKMISRQILLSVCGATSSNDPHSLRRVSVMSLDDLDAINEAVQ